MDVSDGAAAATPPGVRHAHTLTPVTSIGTASGEGASTESHAAAASLPKMKVPVLGAKKGVDFAANESANHRMSTGRITIDVSKDAAKVAAANEKAWKVLPAGDYEEDA